MGECWIFVQIDFVYQIDFHFSSQSMSMGSGHYTVYNQLENTHLGSGKIIFLLALAAGVHLDFSIAMR